jgi:hypothetical protein
MTKKWMTEKWDSGSIFCRARCIDESESRRLEFGFREAFLAERIRWSSVVEGAIRDRRLGW